MEFIWKVVDDAISSGIKGFDADVRSAVRKAAHGLRLSKDEAMAITNEAVHYLQLFDHLFYHPFTFVRFDEVVFSLFFFSFLGAQGAACLYQARKNSRQQN